ncbi:cupin domain-containing protein [Arthrobacter sp. USHLN218]|uniref:cupin domain-containing protein n=1 Tax=Arthrobacter sp. USHLN218 TaxID=3081232 RepID=UPI0030186534
MNLASRFAATRVDSSIVWPDPVPIAHERVLEGAPAAATLVLEDTPAYQLGLWRVSTGEFETDHTGYLEYIHILEGSGQLVDSDGTVTELEPGVTVLMRPGWKGR